MKSRASLGQATGSRLGETVIREPCETRGFSLNRVATRLSEDTPRPKRASLPELHMQHIPQAPTRPRLGEPLSSKRDGVSLKRKLSACAKARARVWVCFCKSRLGETGSPGRGWVTWARLGRLGESVGSRHYSSCNNHIFTSKQ